MTKKKTLTQCQVKQNMSTDSHGYSVQGVGLTRNKIDRPLCRRLRGLDCETAES